MTNKATTTTEITTKEMPRTSPFAVEPPLDLPPDYSDSAEEADEDTDHDGDTTLDGNSYGRLRHLRQGYMPEDCNLSRVARRTKYPKKQKHSSHRGPKSIRATAVLISPSLSLHTQSSDTTPLQNPKTPDLLLDSLLERSVSALEMSNALLQSSVNTRSTLPTLSSPGAGSDLDSDSGPQSETLGVPRRGSDNYSPVVSDEHYDALQSRITTWRNAQSWAGDLDETTRGVNRLSVADHVDVGQDSQSNRRRRDVEREARGSENNITNMSTDSSLEQRTLSSPHPSHECSASSAILVTKTPGEGDRGRAPQLRFEHQQREMLVAPPSRAITRDVEVTSDADTTVSLSTLYSRSMSPRRVTTKRRDITKKKGAYNMLCSLATRSSGRAASTSSAPSSPTPSSPKKELLRTHSNTHEQHLPYKRRCSTSPTRSGPWAGFLRHPQSEIHKLALGRDYIINGLDRRMIPPIETLSLSSQPSTSSSEDDEATILGGQKRKLGPSAKRTVLELRRILDEQPSRQREAKFDISRPPALLQKVGGSGTAAEAGTSNATASVSRLLTKNKHSSSTRPPSPPRQSALKGRSMPGTPISRPVTPPTSYAIEAAIHAAQATAKHSSDPSPGPSTFQIPQALNSFAKSALLAKAKGERLSAFFSPTRSPSGSGTSTPKRITFAELPESYSGGRGRKSRVSRKSKGKRRKKRSLADTDAVENEGWLRWLLGGASASRHDRMGSDGVWGDEPVTTRLMDSHSSNNWAI